MSFKLGKLAKHDIIHVYSSKEVDLKIMELYSKIAKLESINRKNEKMKFNLLEIFKENNYNNKDLMLRKIKSILDNYIDPESEVNNVN